MRRVRMILSAGMVAGSIAAGGALAASSHSEFIKYPAFVNPEATVEVIHDKGLTSELIVNCGGGRTGILTVSKVDRLVCGPDYRCGKDLAVAINRLCR